MRCSVPALVAAWCNLTSFILAVPVISRFAETTTLRLKCFGEKEIPHPNGRTTLSNRKNCETVRNNLYSRHAPLPHSQYYNSSAHCSFSHHMVIAHSHLVVRSHRIIFSLSHSYLLSPYRVTLLSSQLFTLIVCVFCQSHCICLLSVDASSLYLS